MKSVVNFLCKCSVVLLMPTIASAAGTYYTGTYQSPQTRYAQQSYTQRARTASYSQQGVSAYNRNQYANAGYTTQNSRGGQMAKQTGQRSGAPAATQTGRQGFTLGAGISRQTSMWQFEMKESDSILHYDNVDWNVLDVNAGYGFMAGNTPMQIKAGFKYGMQAGDSTMIDDDITNGGYFVTEWVDGDVCLEEDAEGNCIKYKY